MPNKNEFPTPAESDDSVDHSTPREQAGFFLFADTHAIRDEVGEVFELRDLEKQYSLHPEFKGHILGLYRDLAELPEDWVPTEEERTAILNGLLAQRNLGPEGGFVFDMPIGEDDLETFVVTEQQFGGLRRIH